MQTGSDTGAALVARALVPYNQKPDEVEIAALVDDLLRQGESILSRIVEHDAAAAALEDWARLTGEGPTDSPLGNWNHARALARVLKRFRSVLGEQ